MRVLVVAMSVIVLGLDSCGAQPTPQDALTIATDSQVRSVGMTALIIGTMHGTVNSDRTACFRLIEEPDMALFWPYGYSARENPLRVVDSHGNTVAVDGQHIKLGGGFIPWARSKVVLGCGEAANVFAIN